MLTQSIDLDQSQDIEQVVEQLENKEYIKLMKNGSPNKSGNFVYSNTQCDASTQGSLNSSLQPGKFININQPFYQKQNYDILTAQEKVTPTKILLQQQPSSQKKIQYNNNISQSQVKVQQFQQISNNALKTSQVRQFCQPNNCNLQNSTFVSQSQQLKESSIRIQQFQVIPENAQNKQQVVNQQKYQIIYKNPSQQQLTQKQYFPQQNYIKVQNQPQYYIKNNQSYIIQPQNNTQQNNNNNSKIFYISPQKQNNQIKQIPLQQQKTMKTPVKNSNQKQIVNQSPVVYKNVPQKKVSEDFIQQKQNNNSNKDDFQYPVLQKPAYMQNFQRLEGVKLTDSQNI